MSDKLNKNTDKLISLVLMGAISTCALGGCIVSSNYFNSVDKAKERINETRSNAIIENNIPLQSDIVMFEMVYDIKRLGCEYYSDANQSFVLLKNYIKSSTLNNFSKTCAIACIERRAKQLECCGVESFLDSVSVDILYNMERVEDISKKRIVAHNENKSYTPVRYQRIKE